MYRCLFYVYNPLKYMWYKYEVLLWTCVNPTILGSIISKKDESVEYNQSVE